MIDRKLLAAAAAGFTLATGAAFVLHAAGAATPKGYVVAEIEVQDLPTFQSYAAQTPPIIAQHGGRYLARAGRTIALEGAPPATRTVILEFPSAQAAREYFQSPEYQSIAALRHKAATTRSYIVEGVAPETR
jgi:uncharacterized protein (DUF1330 family)